MDVIMNNVRPKDGYKKFESTGIGYGIETTHFTWIPRYLPLVDYLDYWDEKTYKFVWLSKQTFRGYSDSGLTRIVSNKIQNYEVL
jgi:hypothetical protein